MFRVQMHLFSKALCDFTVALVDLIPRIEEGGNSDLGNHLLVYVSSCLAGRGYPTGELPVELAQTAKQEVLRTLTVIHTSRATDEELQYPYLRKLLNFDTRETLNVISLAFQEVEFSGDLGMLKRQRLVNILLEILVPDHANWSQIGALMGFIAGQLMTGLLPPDPVFVDKVHQFVRREASEGESLREHVERENAWLDLLTGGYLDELPAHELVREAKQAGCYRVLEYLYEKNKNYDEILDCYLLDKTRHAEMFSYLQRFAEDREREIFNQIATNLIQLLEIDGKRVSRVVVECFGDRIKSLIGVLDRQSVELFRFMEELTVGQGLVLEPENCELFIELLCKYGREEAVEEFLRNPVNRFRLEVGLEMVERYGRVEAAVVLYEKRGDFKTAFMKSLEVMVKEKSNGECWTVDMAEQQALKVASLCARATENVGDDGERVELWTMFLEVVLVRADLVGVKKQVLHMASGHMDLTKLVQLVLKSSTGGREETEGGNFGDIRHLLMGMLANSRYEMMLLETTGRVLGTDLHGQFVRERNLARHGLAIRTVVCVECGHDFKGIGEGEKVLVFEGCGHAVHEKCQPRGVDEEEGYCKCPRCRKKGRLGSAERRLVARPKVNACDELIGKMASGEGLQLGAPPPPRIK